MVSGINNEVILVARVFLAALYFIFGWRKVFDYSGTVDQMARDSLPTPRLAAAVAIFMEVPASFAVAVGAFTRPSAALMALYTLGTSLVEHRYWSAKGPGKLESMENFYKNLSITGGFLLLYVTGGGIYSIDALLGIAPP